MSGDDALQQNRDAFFAIPLANSIKSKLQSIRYALYGFNGSEYAFGPLECERCATAMWPYNQTI